MMRKFRILIVFMIGLLFFLIPAEKQVYGMIPTEVESIGEEKIRSIQKLYDYITKLGVENEIIREIDPEGMVDSLYESGEGNISTYRIENLLYNYAFKEIKAVIKLLSSVIVICLVCGLLTQLQSAFSNNEVSSISYYVCFAMILLIMGKSFIIVVTLAQDTIQSLSGFMEALMPVMVMLLAGVGGFTQATFMDPIIIFVVDFSAKIITNFIFPMIILSFILSFVNNLSKDNKVKSLGSLFGQITLWVQGLMLTVFVGTITIRSMVSSSIDEVTLKTAKYTVDKVVPVVGKALSDTIATMAGYSLLLKSAIGTLGMVIVIIIIVAPILKIVVFSFMFKLTAAIIEPISDSRIVDSINDAGKAVALILSCVICISVMAFILIAIVAGTGKGVMFS